jgi:type II secretory pathway component PulJ
MKTQHLPKLTRSGYSLVEISVALSAATLLGLTFFQVLNAGIILFAKNTAVNASHEESRQGLNRLTRDLHAAISVPELRSAPASFTGTWTAPVVDPPDRRRRFIPEPGRGSELRLERSEQSGPDHDSR